MFTPDRITDHNEDIEELHKELASRNYRIVDYQFRTDDDGETGYYTCTCTYKDPIFRECEEATITIALGYDQDMGFRHLHKMTVSLPHTYDRDYPCTFEEALGVCTKDINSRISEERKVHDFIELGLMAEEIARAGILLYDVYYRQPLQKMQ